MTAKEKAKNEAVRVKMLAYRRENGLTIVDMSRAVGVSGALIDIVERGGITHPNIARRIGKAYNLTAAEIKTLRPSDEVIRQAERQTLTEEQNMRKALTINS